MSMRISLYTLYIELLNQNSAATTKGYSGCPDWVRGWGLEISNKA